MVVTKANKGKKPNGTDASGSVKQLPQKLSASGAIMSKKGRKRNGKVAESPGSAKQQPQKQSASKAGLDGGPGGKTAGSAKQQPQKRSASKAGLDGGPGGKTAGAAKQQPQKRSASKAGLDGGPGGKTGKGRGFAPTSFRSLSDREADSKSELYRTIKISNLPNIPESQLTAQLLSQLRKHLKHGKVVKHEFVISGPAKQFKVVLKSPEAAYAAKKLNGFLLEGRHLIVCHPDDGFRMTNNKIVINDMPEDVDDEDIWETFGSIGQIYAFFRKRTSQYCVLTFETLEAKKQALQKPKKKCKNHVVTVQDYPGDKWVKTVMLSNLSAETTAADVENFVKKVGPIDKVSLHKDGSAVVQFKNESDVLKACSLDGTNLNDQKIELLIHGASYVQLCDQKKKKKIEGGDDDDEEERDEDDDEEGEEDDDEEGGEENDEEGEENDDEEGEEDDEEGGEEDDEEGEEEGDNDEDENAED